MSEERRLFFALWPDDDARAELARVAGNVELHQAARRVPPEKMHVTLAFMGNTSADRQRCFEKAAEDVKGEPFRLVLDRYFDTDLGLLENRSFFSTARHPYDFVDVTENILASADARAARAGGRWAR